MNAPTSSSALGRRKQLLLDHVEATIHTQEHWRKLNAAYYEEDRRFMRFLIPPGKCVLELGCGRGDLLAALQPAVGVGIDFSPSAIALAKQLYPQLQFHLGDAEDISTMAQIQGSFDYIVIADTIGMFENIDDTLKLVYRLCGPSTRLIISYYSHLWEPLLKLGETLGLKSRHPKINYMVTADFLNLMDLADFEMVREERRQLIPRHWFGLGPLINRYIASLPGIRKLALRTYVVGRPMVRFADRKLSATVVIPCRNESGNIENAILRMPKFAERQEIIFVEGNSSDGTLEECERVRDTYGDRWDIKVFKQDGKGKGDAVRKGFAVATGDVLMILDADLTMAARSSPEISHGDRKREGRICKRDTSDLPNGR